MIGTQRLIIILLALTLVTGWATDLYQDSYENYETTRVNELIVFGEEYSQEVSNTTGGSKSADTIYATETTYGSTISMGKGIFDILMKGLDPWPFESSKTEFSTPLETALKSMILLMKALLYVLVGVEVYMVIKNKKTN